MSVTEPLNKGGQAGLAPEGSLVAFTALGAGLHWGSVLMRGCDGIQFLTGGQRDEP